MYQPVVLVHGGAAYIPEDRIEGKMKGVKIAAHEAYDVLLDGGSVVDAVETACRIMENDEYFNAGYGGVLNRDGEVELDASIMDGKSLGAGAVAIVKGVKNPISLARCVMEKTPHVLIAADGTFKLAKENGIPIVPNRDLISGYARQILDEFIKNGRLPEEIGEKGGTVGAVACDKNGNVAAGTSTGGTNGQLGGRIGDVPLIGCGTYADNNVGAVSCTGNGEAITKWCLAHSIIQRMEKKIPACVAIETNLESMGVNLKANAGAIAVSKRADIGFYFTTEHMPWAYVQNDRLFYGYEPDQKTSMLLSEHIDKVKPERKSNCVCVKECGL